MKLRTFTACSLASVLSIGFFTTAHAAAPAEILAPGIEHYSSVVAGWRVNMIHFAPGTVDLKVVAANGLQKTSQMCPVNVCTNGGFFNVKPEWGPKGAPIGDVIATNSKEAGLQGHPPTRQLNIQSANKLTTENQCLPNTTFCVGGGYRLLQGGKPYLYPPYPITPDGKEDPTVGPNPHTVVCWNDAGNLWFVVSDGKEGKQGLAMIQAGQQCLAQGATDAIGMDNGGSSTLTEWGHVVNHPSDATGERPVANALMAVCKVPCPPPAPPPPKPKPVVTAPKPPPTTAPATTTSTSTTTTSTTTTTLPMPPPVSLPAVAIRTSAKRPAAPVWVAAFGLLLVSGSLCWRLRKQAA